MYSYLPKKEIRCPNTAKIPEVHLRTIPVTFFQNRRKCTL